jgi:CRISPR/Cas system-associated endoribonuclease Cas2
MLILVPDDVATVEKAGQRRLRGVAQACEDYGTRVQSSSAWISRSNRPRNDTHSF